MNLIMTRWQQMLTLMSRDLESSLFVSDSSLKYLLILVQHLCLCLLLPVSFINPFVCVCVSQVFGRQQGSSEDHDPRGDHCLRPRPLPSCPAGGVDGQAGLPLEAAGGVQESVCHFLSFA